MMTSDEWWLAAGLIFAVVGYRLACVFLYGVAMKWDSETWDERG